MCVLNADPSCKYNYVSCQGRKKMFLDGEADLEYMQLRSGRWPNIPRGSGGMLSKDALKSILVHSEIKSKLDSNSIQLASW